MKHIPMLDLRLEYEFMKNDINLAIQRCLDQQRWIMGPEVNQLEKRVAEYLGVKYCTGVSSGTDALVLSLRALAMKLKGKEYFDSNDRIITTPFSFVATGDSILRSGAIPVFVDIDISTFTIDPTEIKKYLKKNNNGKVVGIIPVHLYGQACAIDKITEIAEEYGLFVIEDVAQAFGSNSGTKKLGSFGDTGAFSFFPSKNLGGFGDGGMVATNDEEVFEIIKMLIKHGGKDKYNSEHIGYNARLDTLQAAILLVKMKYVEEFNERRRTVAKIYNEGLQGVKELSLPNYSKDKSHVYNQYTIRVDKRERDELIKNLKNRGIDTMVYYPVPLHKMKLFSGENFKERILRNSEMAAEQVISLPIEPLYERGTIQYIIDTIKEIYRGS